VRTATCFTDQQGMADTTKTIEFIKFHDTARNEIILDSLILEEFSEYMESLL
jgi:hypothetical protein